MFIYYLLSIILCTGINQIQWALELMKCMRVDFSYPEGIGKIVIVLEKQLLELYAKVGEKLEEIKEKQEKQEQGQIEEAEENNSQSKYIYVYNIFYIKYV